SNMHPAAYLPSRIFSCCMSGLALDRDLHSFPTRRSSDLTLVLDGSGPARRLELAGADELLLITLSELEHRLSYAPDAPPFADRRSEEHTSELQSRENLVCRLLLEK